MAAGLAGFGAEAAGSRHRASPGTAEHVLLRGRRLHRFTADPFTEWQAAESPGKWFDVNVKKQPAKHPPIVK